MRVGIIGTRGIPNNYGGFEQFAEHLSVYLVNRGHTVYVYNSHNHSNQEDSWKGVHIIHQHDPEYKIGTAGQFIYDLNCILDSRKRNFDIILNLGYTSSSVWHRFFPKTSVVITNMDGLEWKRSKYSVLVQRFLIYAEKLAVESSDVLVADSRAIRAYIQSRYNKDSYYIAYGASKFTTPDLKVLERFSVGAFEYDLIIARMEPENNIETILDGYVSSGVQRKLLVVGNHQNKFGQYLTQKFRSSANIIFMGTIFDQSLVNNLRHYSNVYFHGHSVGGTNPSLLESMACGCLIFAHDNEFNRAILGNDAKYFANAGEVAKTLSLFPTELRDEFAKHNYKKIEEEFSWPAIVEAYESMMLNSLEQRNM